MLNAFHRYRGVTVEQPALARTVLHGDSFYARAFGLEKRNPARGPRIWPLSELAFPEMPSILFNLNS